VITIVIPTYNEEKNISKIFKKLINIRLISEIIFVDDNSSDKTEHELSKLKKSKKLKFFIRKEKERDLSKSVVFGFHKSKNNTILVMDCDLQHDPKYIKKLWSQLKEKKYDIVVASRFLKNNYSGNVSYLRTLISKLAIYFINIIFGKKTSDPLSGFFMCDKRLVLKYKKKLYQKGYKILFDIIYNTHNKIRVKDVEIRFKKRVHERSKFNIQVIWLFLKQIIFTKFVVKK
tara:strand:- start:67 stop:759 length:693 start_codon:yes stop_codon:yes gene_type:complete